MSDPLQQHQAPPVEQATPIAATRPPRARHRADREGEPREWAWVEQWRANDEPTPWGPGLFIAAFAATVVACAVFVISEGLADVPVFAVIANVVVVAGLTPALWLSRTLPVLRWVSLGGVVGVIVAWTMALIVL